MNNLLYYDSLVKAEISKMKYLPPKQSSEYSNLSDTELPEGVFRNVYDNKPSYYQYVKPNLSEEQIQTIMLAKCAYQLKIIKGCAIFFTIIAGLSLVVTFVSLLL